MTISVTCGECAANYQVKDAHAGRQFKCKACGAGVRVPVAEDDDLEFEDDAPDEFEEERPIRRRPPTPTGRPRPQRSASGRERGPQRREPPQKQRGGVPTVVWIIGGGCLTMIVVVVVAIGLFVGAVRKAGERNQISPAEVRRRLEHNRQLREESLVREGLAAKPGPGGNNQAGGGGTTENGGAQPPSIPRDFDPRDLPDNGVAINKLVLVESVGDFHPPRFQLSTPDVDFSPDGEAVAYLHVDDSGEVDRSWIAIYDIRTRKKVSEIVVPKANEIEYSPDGQSIACVHLQSYDDPGQIYVFDTVSSKETKVFNLLGVAICQFSPDGKSIAAATTDALHLINVNTSKIRLIEKLTTRPSAIEFTADGSRLIVATHKSSDDQQGGKVIIWDVASEKRVRTLSAQDTDEEFYAMSISPDGRFVAASRSSHGGYVWNLQSGELVTDMKCQDPSFGVKFLPDSQKLILCTLDEDAGDGVATLFDVPSGEKRATLVADPFSCGFDFERNPAISPDGKWFASVRTETAPTFWNVSEENIEANRKGVLGADDSVMTQRQFLNRFLLNPKKAHNQFAGKYVDLDVQLGYQRLTPETKTLSLETNSKMVRAKHDDEERRYSIKIAGFGDPVETRPTLTSKQTARIRARYDYVSQTWGTVYLSDCTFLEIGDDPTISMTAEELTRAIAEDTYAACEKYSEIPVFITGTFLKYDTGQVGDIKQAIVLKGHEVSDGGTWMVTLPISHTYDEAPIPEGKQLKVRGICKGCDCYTNGIQIDRWEFVDE